MRSGRRLFWTLATVLTISLCGRAPAAEPNLDMPLLAHWKFDEPAATQSLLEASGDKAMEPQAAGIGRVRGVHGSALELRGTHRLEVRLPLQGDLERISFSAWTRPVDLESYKEIFRQECEKRLLFSYQDQGRILSLGLNVDGYVECDAPIDPAQTLDGAWHHCAATFDGEFMRVYFDGKEIGSLRRPGKIAMEPGVPAFIASLDGGREHFQGGLDDLRIYREALTPADIQAIYQAGLKSLAQGTKEAEAKLAAFYVQGESLAATLANCRRNIAEKGIAVEPDEALLVLVKFKAEFPQDCVQFQEWTGAPATACLTGDFQRQQAERLVELLMEYRPLTEEQRRKLTPEQVRKWEEHAAIERKLETLKQTGTAAEFSPGWVEVILEAGRRIEFRPRVQEAVAPYIRPSTPETRDLTAEEAQEVLRRDWLHQADGQPTSDRIEREIDWTRTLAERIRLASGVDFSHELAELQSLDRKQPAVDLYFQVRQLKRRIMFRNPAIDFTKLLLVDMPYPHGNEWRHETRHRLGYMAVPGGRLLVLDGLSPQGHLTQLMPQPPLHGSFWRPDLSFDGRKIVFCFKPHNEKSFHLYEIGVDGSGLRQLTDGAYDDLDPIYLPDGHILFSTTRGHSYVRCMPPTNAFVLARCDADGKNIYLVSQNNEPDYLPSMMNDGRVLYTRWEYTDKPLWRAQKLWTMNPDGTYVATFWGNQSVWPDLMKDARAIPGSRRVMFTGSAHHDWFAGSVGIIDPDRGLNFPDGLTKVTADVPWPECGNGPVDPVESPRYHASGSYPAYYSPYPLGERDFFVSALRGGKFCLYLMDVDGNRELIYEGTHNIFHAIPLRRRPSPPTIADRVAWPSRDERNAPQGGVLYSGNVYFGAPPELHGKAKHLRVLHIDPKTYTYWHIRPYISTGPVVSAVQSEGVKRILGTVPIEPDGSVAFHVPPGKALHFQLLDENYRALQTMRSFVGAMPGERRGCLGCHESHSRTPEIEYQSTALRKEPAAIAPPPWGEDTVSYPRYVQPVLDRYCGKCHQGDGEGVKTLDLTDRPGALGFSEPYWLLVGRPTWGQPYQRPANPPPGFGIANVLMVEGYGQVDPLAYKTPPPMVHLSYKSRLVEIASSGKHYDVKVDAVNLQRLIAWIDAMCPYRGDDEVRAIDDPVFQGVDWLAIRPRIKTAPRIIRPGPVD